MDVVVVSGLVAGLTAAIGVVMRLRKRPDPDAPDTRRATRLRQLAVKPGRFTDDELDEIAAIRRR